MLRFLRHLFTFPPASSSIPSKILPVLLFLSVIVITVFSIHEFKGREESPVRFAVAEASTSGSFDVRVLAIGFNPTDATGNVAERYFNLGGRTAEEAEDEIFTGTIDAFKRLSNNTINYTIVHKTHITSFPEYTNGYQFTVDNYVECVWGRPEFNPTKCEQQKHAFDHTAWLSANNICALAQQYNADEVWVVSAPYVMTWESFMFGPGGGFPVNSNQYFSAPQCSKNYVLMDPTYERIEPFLHIYGHRIESFMNYLTEDWNLQDKTNYWENFAAVSRYGLPNGAYGPTSCGNAHYPANAAAAYDFDNQTAREFNCSDWNSFPNVTGVTTTIDCTAWGCTDNGWQEYWFGAVPRSEGETTLTGINENQFPVKKNWWYYILYPEHAIAQKMLQTTLPTPTPRDLGPYQIGYWDLGEVTGATLQDRSGNNQHATATGTTSVSGIAGNGRRLNGSGDIITVPNHTSFSGMQDLSISLWARPEDMNAADTLVCKQTGSAPYTYCLFWIPEFQKAAFRVNSDGGDLMSPANSVLRNTWTHVVATYKGSTGQRALYINGALCSGCASTITPGSVGTNTANLVFGNRYGGEQLTGALDEVRMYNTVLNSVEVAELYASPGPQPTPTPTATPTNTPTPTMTPTPTPTPAPITVTLNPIADAYVRSNAQSRNYGTQSTMITDNSPIYYSYLKYNLTPYAGKTLVSATFRVRVGNDSSSATQSVYGMSDISWTETGVKYSNRPSLGSSVVGTFAGNQTNTWKTVDATSFLSTRMGQTVSFGMSSSSSDSMNMASREATSANRPQLVLIYR